MRENAEQNNSEYGHFLLSVIFLLKIVEINEFMENVKNGSLMETGSSYDKRFVCSDPRQND